jgi:archaellum component FlaC
MDTIAYCAPELLHEGGTPSEGSDVWALGLTIYEVLTGSTVFDSHLSLVGLIAAIGGSDRPEVPPFVHPELKHVITSCWDADPTKRMTIVEIDELLSSVEWRLVEGADAEAVQEFLAKQPLDETASREQVWDRLKRREAEIARLQSEIAQRKVEADGRRVENAALGEQNSRLQAEAAQLSAGTAQLAAENAELKGVIDGRDAEIERLRQEITQANAERARIEAENGQLAAADALVKADNAQLASEIAQLKSEGARLRVEVEGRDAEIAGLKERSGQVEAENVQLKGRVDGHEAEIGKLRDESSQQKARVGRRDDEIAKLKRENSWVMEEHAGLRARLDGRGRETEGLRWEIRKLKDEIARLAAAPAPLQRSPSLPRPARHPTGTLLALNQAKICEFGVPLTRARMLMDVKGPFEMEQFVTLVVTPGVKPTMLLVECRPGFVIGGCAAVAWPTDEGTIGGAPIYASDPAKRSFIFSLEGRARAFGLQRAEQALLRMTDGKVRGFRFERDITVCDNGQCWVDCNAYAGGRDDGIFPTEKVRFTHFELWAL